MQSINQSLSVAASFLFTSPLQADHHPALSMAQPPKAAVAKSKEKGERSLYIYQAQVKGAPNQIDQKCLEEFDMASVQAALHPVAPEPEPVPVPVEPKPKPPTRAKATARKPASKGSGSKKGAVSDTEKETTTQRTGRSARTKDGSGSAPLGPLPAGAPEVGHQTKIQHLHTDDVRRVADSLSSPGYYHGFLPRDEIENMLKKNGNFLLRATDHANERRIAVSVLWEGKPRHVLLNRSSKGWWFLSHNYCMETIEQLINLHRDRKIAVNVMGAMIQRSVARSRWQLLHEDIKEKKKLGNGAFGEVWSGLLYNKQRVAIKKMLTTGPVTKEQRRQFVGEARLMRQLEHDNIVRVLGVAANEEPIMLVMELLSGGSLLGVLRNKKDPPAPPLLDRFIVDAARGMVYLEMKRFIHRDLAARNCLLNEDKRVKISDFGLSLVSTGAHRETQTMKVPIKWLAPEVLTKMLYSHKSDVWAFGVMCWEVYTLGKEPYPGMTNADTKQKVVSEGYMMPLPIRMPKHIQKLVTEMWNKDSEHRPTFEHINARLNAK